MDEVIVRLADIPTLGVTVLDTNGDYNIYINSNLLREQQKEVLAHELEHINKDHFYIDKSVEECEEEADQL